MKVLQETNLDAHVSIGHKSNTETFGISHSSAFFTIISKELYSNGILAALREVICNAWDSHIKSNVTDTPIDISYDESSRTITIRDYGSGIPHDKFKDIALIYGNSTKAESLDETGGFGLGFKAPFAQGESFTAVNMCDGIRRVHLLKSALVTDSGSPEADLLVEVPTDETGMEISFEITEDHYARKIGEYVRGLIVHGGINANLNGEHIRAVMDSDIKHGYYIIDNVKDTPFTAINYPLFRNAYYHGSKNVFFRYGSVVYPSEYSIPSVSAGIVITLEPGTVAIPPSRESLSNTPHNNRILSKKVDDVKKHISKLKNNKNLFKTDIPHRVDFLLKRAATPERSQRDINNNAINGSYHTGPKYYRENHKLNSQEKYNYVANRDFLTPRLVINELFKRKLATRLPKGTDTTSIVRKLIRNGFDPNKLAFPEIRNNAVMVIGSYEKDLESLGKRNSRVEWGYILERKEIGKLPVITKLFEDMGFVVYETITARNKLNDEARERARQTRLANASKPKIAKIHKAILPGDFSKIGGYNIKYIRESYLKNLTEVDVNEYKYVHKISVGIGAVSISPVMRYDNSAFSNRLLESLAIKDKVLFVRTLNEYKALIKAGLKDWSEHIEEEFQKSVKQPYFSAVLNTYDTRRSDWLTKIYYILKDTPELYRRKYRSLSDYHFDIISYYIIRKFIKISGESSEYRKEILSNKEKFAGSPLINVNEGLFNFMIRNAVTVKSYPEKMVGYFKKELLKERL